MRFIDLFAGVGGFRFGMEQAGHEAVGWCEKDRFAQKSYRTIHDTGGEWFEDDIRTVEPSELPGFETLCAGFPCQSFSVAGNRGGFEDTRGTLFFEIARIAKEREPKYLFLENVRGLLSHDGGRTFGTIINTLHDLGYSVEWQVLNSKNFGVPQNRERVFIVGHFGGFGGRQVFPIKRENRETVGELKQVGNYRAEESSIDNPETGRVYDTGGISPCLNTMGGGDREPKITVRACITPERLNKRQNGRRFKEPGEPSFCVNTVDRHGVEYKGRIRKLTPKECWRLQGFPDWAFEKAQEVNSDTQLYRQAGNAVSVPVIKAIARRLKND